MDGKFGFIDSLGNVVIKPQNKYVSNFTEDGYAYVISDMRVAEDSSVVVNYGYINKQNELVIDTKNIFTIGRDVPNWNQSVINILKEFNAGTLEFSERLFDIFYFSSDRFVFQNENTKLLGYLMNYE